MTLRRLAILGLALVSLSLPISACHVSGHVAPGQMKHVIAPPPGHGSVPPGQAKKY